jgi:hypothetical protein
MKTTVEISDELFDEAKALAARQQTTLRALVEEGLRWVLSQRRRERRYTLKDASVPGRGVRAGVREGDWQRIRELIYKGRGD